MQNFAILKPSKNLKLTCTRVLSIKIKNYEKSFTKIFFSIIFWVKMEKGKKVFFVQKKKKSLRIAKQYKYNRFN